jgi:transposase
MAIANSALKTSRALAMKEIAHSLWSYVCIGVAEKEWKRLLSRMARCRLDPMKKLANSLKEHLWMIINAIRLKANSGNAESNHSRIQRVKKMACGFRDTENFKMAVYFLLGGLDLQPNLSATR